MKDYIGQDTPHARANPTVYVLGFAFDRTTMWPQVCLIRKEKPEWQRGKLNGVGGKQEPGEDGRRAMAREFLEETGVETYSGQWHKFHVMRFANGAVIHCYATDLPLGAQVRTMEMESVGMYPMHNIPPIRIPNLDWLIPMAYQELIATPQERMICNG